jgi:acetyl-CoA carboxylase carboxyl transferase subunit beta
MSSGQIDVSIEHKHADPERRDGAGHPNTCPSCGSHFRDDELEASLWVCGHCGYHFRMPSRSRIAWLCDPGSFAEEATDVRSADPLDFYDLRPYRERLAEAELNTGLNDAIVVGAGTLDGLPLELAVMDFSFMGGSMGSAVGEKFVRASDSAIAAERPLLLVTASGGARMQEGILALMQLAKTVAAIDELHEARLPLFCVLTDPTTGGAMASFATLGDVLIAEPGALLAFTGPRVVQELVKEKLSEDFGRSEQHLRFGQIDAIVPRAEQRQYLARLLRLFAR